jgi:tripartite-type tricarboxylate transporter receptor subunit TctC
MLRRALLATPALLAPAFAQAQAWPTRPVRIVVPFAAGGLADQLARPLAARLQAVLGQPFVVENRPGAGGNIAGDFVAKSAPDGYTWLLGSIGPLAANQFLFPSMPYDTRTAFAPASLLVNTPKVVAVNPARPWRTLEELLEAARARPGSLRAGSAGNGSSLHLALEVMNRRAGVDITHVPYRGAAPAVTDLIAGNIDLMVDNLPNILPQITGGQVRALAVATEQRLPQLPDVPTATEAGLRGFVFGTWFGLAGPARTPAEVVARFSASVDAALREREIGGRWREQGAIVVGGTPEAFSTFIAAQMTELEGVIRAANIRAE